MHFFMRNWGTWMSMENDRALNTGVYPACFNLSGAMLVVD